MIIFLHYNVITMALCVLCSPLLEKLFFFFCSHSLFSFLEKKKKTFRSLSFLYSFIAIYVWVRHSVFVPENGFIVLFWFKCIPTTPGIVPNILQRLQKRIISSARDIASVRFERCYLGCVRSIFFGPSINIVAVLSTKALFFSLSFYSPNCFGFWICRFM